MSSTSSWAFSLKADFHRELMKYRKLDGNGKEQLPQDSSLQHPKENEQKDYGLGPSQIPNPLHWFINHHSLHGQTLQLCFQFTEFPTAATEIVLHGVQGGIQGNARGVVPWERCPAISAALQPRGRSGRSLPSQQLRPCLAVPSSH